MGIEPLWRKVHGPMDDGLERGSEEGVLPHDVVPASLLDDDAPGRRIALRMRLAWLHRRLAGVQSRSGDTLVWAATAFWCGIMAWFALPAWPGRGRGLMLLGLAMAVLLLRVLAMRQMQRLALNMMLQPLWLPALILAGLGWMALRADLVETTLLPANVGMVSFAGQVQEVWMAGPDKARLVVAVHDLPAVKEPYRPERVRMTVRLPKKPESLAARWQALPLPGDPIAGRIRLRRLPEPAAPDAHDPRRALWFAGVGAVAFAHHAWLKMRQETAGGSAEQTCPGCTLSLRLERELERLRRKVAKAIEAAVTDPHAAALAMALLTGTRGALAEEERAVLRAAGLAHILAISGLHLALVAGSVFWIVRALLAAVPVIALTWPVRRISALAALSAAFAYMLLSGNSVATQRAFVMLAVATLALMLDRPAITMRNLGLAAFVVLIVRPEAAVTAGFQMSFAAVMALIATWEALRHVLSEREKGLSDDRTTDSHVRRWLQRGLKGAGALVLSTLVAGLATLPPALWHFQQAAPWSLAGNLVSLPVLSLVVMPLGLMGLAGMPLGLEWLPWQGMQAGLEIMRAWARFVSAWPGAHTLLPAPPLPAVLLASAGMIWLALRRDAWRLLGLPVAVFMLLWLTSPRPDVLVDAHARLVAVRNDDGRLVPLALAGSGVGYVLKQWLRRDGDETAPEAALKRPGWRCEERLCRFDCMHGRRIWALLRPVGRSRTAKRTAQASADRDPSPCPLLKPGDLFVSAVPLRGACRQKGAVIIDRFDVWRHGAHALTADPDGSDWRMRTTADAAAGRPWHRPPRPHREVLKHSPKQSGGKVAR